MFQFMAVTLIIALLAFPVAPCSRLMACANAGDHGTAVHYDHSQRVCDALAANYCSWSQGKASGAASRCTCLELKPPAITSQIQGFWPDFSVPVGELEITGPQFCTGPYSFAGVSYGRSPWDYGGYILYLTNSFRS